MTLDEAKRDLLAEVPIGRRPEALRKIEGICRLTERALPVIATCCECGWYESTPGLCLHPKIEAAREDASVLGAVGDGKGAPPPAWCPLIKGSKA